MSNLTALTGESGMTKDEQELYKSFLDAVIRITDFAICPKYSSTDIQFNEWTVEIRSSQMGFLFKNSLTNHFFEYKNSCLSFYNGYEHYKARDYKYLICLHAIRESYENGNKYEFIYMLNRDSLFIYEILRINEDLKLMMQKLYDDVKAELEAFTQHVHSLQKWIVKADKI